MKIEPSRRARDLQRTLIRQMFDAAPPDAINLGLGQPDLATPAVACLGGVSAIVRGRTAYTSTAGDAELREALARHYRPISSGPESVLVTVGSQEAMFVACLGLLDAGDELLYPDPGYPAYPVVAGLIGARPIPYPLRAERRFRLDASDVEARLTPRTRAVMLCAPSNPTGATIDRADLEELTRLLTSRGIPWLSDEVYSGFCYEGQFLSPAEIAPDGGLIISGLSKEMSMAGWRIGWVVGPPEILARLIAVHQYVVTCASSVSQAAAVASFSSAGAAARRRHLERFRRRRAVMSVELSRLPGVRFFEPDGAFYFFVDVSSHGDSMELGSRILERRRVVTIPGEAFGAGGRGFLRLSFAAREVEIREGIRRIGEELAAGPG
jgi:aspartate/methionine/tyrosine aminotransferase